MALRSLGGGGPGVPLDPPDGETFGCRLSFEGYTKADAVDFKMPLS
jgi:hypothetical protein